MKLCWNVKNADNVGDAVALLRNKSHLCVESPQSATRCCSFGRISGLIKARNHALAVLSPFVDAVNNATSTQGLNQARDAYNDACAKYFSIEKRRGYVVLSLLYTE